MIHRDFKPHNVLRANDGHIYVTDFGLARGQIEEGPELVPIALPVEEIASGSQPRRKRDLILDSPLTQTGVLIGTPAYMAPEQFAGAMPDPKSDQFAFCVTAWQALTGERPFRGESLTQIEAAAREGAAKLDAAAMPPALRAVLVRGLDPSPAARWPDMAALLDALALAAKPGKPRRRWLVPVLAASVLLAGGIVVAIAASQQNKHAEEICGPASEAFEPVWGKERRAFFGRNTNPALIAVPLVMQPLAKGWMRSYTQACTGERTPAKQERITCLLELRDTLKQRLDEVEAGGAHIGDIASLTGGMIACDASTVHDFSRLGDEDPDLDLPEPPEPPEPPEIEPPKRR